MKIDGKDVRLPKRFKAKWVKALRSGEYKQGKNGLYNSDGSYCCLGVACKIVGNSNEELGLIGYIEPELIKDYKKVPSILEREEELASKLAKMNDTGKSFNQIAAYIDRYL